MVCSLPLSFVEPQGGHKYLTAVGPGGQGGRWATTGQHAPPGARLSTLSADLTGGAPGARALGAPSPPPRRKVVVRRGKRNGQEWTEAVFERIYQP